MHRVIVVIFRSKKHSTNQRADIHITGAIVLVFSQKTPTKKNNRQCVATVGETLISQNTKFQHEKM